MVKEVPFERAFSVAGYYNRLFHCKIKFSDGFRWTFFFFAFFKWQGYKPHFISDGLMSLVCGPSDAFLFPS